MICGSGSGNVTLLLLDVTLVTWKLRGVVPIGFIAIVETLSGREKFIVNFPIPLSVIEETFAPFMMSPPGRN
jgi:hypothetical protein